MNTCSTCKFFRPDPEDEEGNGECRKRQPVVTRSTLGIWWLWLNEKNSDWPEVTEEDWCGEWEK